MINEKFKSPLMQDYIREIIGKMAEYKRKNAAEMFIIKAREREIESIKEALTDLGIEFGEDFDPELVDIEEWR